MTAPATVSAGMIRICCCSERLADRGDDLRLGEARTDRIEADPLGREARPERAGETDDGVLVGRVQRIVRDRGQAGERGRRDDRPAAARPHRGQDGVRAEHDAVEVGAHRPPVEGEVEVLADAATGRDARVEEGVVEPPVPFDREGDRREVRVEVRDVGGDEAPAELRGDALAALPIEIGDHDGGAGLA